MPGKKRDIIEGSVGVNRPTGQRSTSWFFGIGINEYKEFSDLNNAVKDVEDIQQILTKMYDIPPENSKLLLNGEANEENIIDELDQLADHIGEDDKLLIYYSGHGHFNKKTGLGYWIPHDAKKNKTARYIRNSTIRDYIKVIKARHILLISDSCFSGSLFARGSSRSSSSAFDELETIPSRWAICSGRHDEEVYDGEPGQNSPFAQSIIDTLKNNQRKSFNVAKLADRVVEQTRANYEQLPEGNPLYGVGHKGGQYIFYLKANEVEDWLACEKTGTLVGYQLFLGKYPDGKYAQKAETQITFLKEEQAWEKARKENTILAYFDYDRNHPQGRYNRQALDAIKELEEEQAWQNAQRRDSLSAYRKYTMDYPNGKYRKEANDKLDSIANKQREPRLWEQAKAKNTVSSFENYLKAFPAGAFANEAKAQLKALDQAADQKEKEAQKEQEARNLAKKSAAAEKERKEQAKIKQEQQQKDARNRASQQKEKQAAQVAQIKKHARWAVPALIVLLLISIMVGRAGKKGGFVEGELTIQEPNVVIVDDQALVSGQVTDGKEPLIGTSIFVKNTAIGSISDMDGNFSIKVPYDAEALVFTYTGFKSKEVPIKSRISAAIKKQGRGSVEPQKETKSGGNSVNKDKIAWEAAKRRNTISAYNLYLRNFPNGAYASKAKTAIADLQKQEDLRIRTRKEG